MRWSIAPFLLLTCSACAQVYFGNRAGVSIGKEVLRDADGYSGINIHDDHTFQLLGCNFGASVEFPLNDHFSLQMEFGYMEKGYVSPKAAIPGSLEQKVRLGYADLTTLFKWTALSGNTRPEVFLGPTLAHPLRTRDETRSDMLVYETGTFDEVVRTHAFNVRDNLAEWEFSAVFGAGFIIQPGVARIHVGYRYVLGLSNIYRYVVDYTDVNGSLLGSGSMFNRTHMITLGYSIPLSREVWTETPAPR